MAGTPLTVDEREEILVGLARGDSCAEIGRWLKRPGCTISREVRRNGKRRGYSAVTAQRHTDKRRARPKTPKLLADPALARFIERDLHEGFSPAAIVVRLADAGMPSVVHESIYQALYSPTFCGITLLPHQCLRTRRRKRRTRGRSCQKRSWRSDINLIDTRPPAANGRTEEGNWEGDLIVGTRSASAIITLVERVSRKAMVIHLPRRHDTLEVIPALIGEFESIPRHLRRSLTWDQGAELAGWRHLEEVLDLPVFFCHPHSPWERPSNENLNRQLRYWFPKGCDLRAYDQTALDRATNVLNNQPRRLLGWQTANQVYGDLAVR
jgi:IS30 family transposase